MAASVYRAPLLGPHFRYEMMRTSRRGNLILLRLLYVLLLSLMFFSWYEGWFRADRCTLYRTSIRAVGMIPVNQSAALAQLAEEFFNYFAATQFAVLFVLTPVLVGGAITEEKERRTIAFLLTTYLTDREIILNKLTTRLGQVLLLALTGLPFLGILQLLGGVDFRLVLETFLATFGFMVSLSAFALLQSVLLARTWVSVLCTWGCATAYLVVSPCLPLLNVGNPLIWRSGWENPCVLPTSMLSSFSLDLPVPLLVFYMLFHLLCTLLFCTLAVRWLRVQALRLPVPSSLTQPMPEYQMSAPSLPEHSNNNFTDRFYHLLDFAPLFWKEYIFGRHLFMFEHRSFLVLATLSIGTLCLVLPVESSRVVFYLSLCCWLLGVAFRAARSFTSEREQQTLDALRGIPVSSTSLVVTKWLASAFQPTLGVFGIILVWGCSTLGMHIHVLALPMLLALVLAFASFTAAVGILFSVFQQSGLRALVWTFSVLIAVQILASGFHGTIQDGLQVTLLGYRIDPQENDPFWVAQWYWQLAWLPADFRRCSQIAFYVLSYGLPVPILLAVSIWRLRAEAGPRPLSKSA